MQTLHRNTQIHPMCCPQEFPGRASSFHAILFIHRVATLTPRPSAETQCVQDDTGTKVCVHVCMTLRVTASCWGQSLQLSVSLPEPVQSLRVRTPSMSGRTSSGATKAKSSLLAGRLRQNETADCHWEAVRVALNRFKDDGRVSN